MPFTYSISNTDRPTGVIHLRMILMSRVIIGSDHAGFTLKVAIRDYLTSLNYQVVDVGTHVKQSCHYPDYAQHMKQLIQPQDRGILVCGSGIGIGVAANKCGLPCSTAYNEFTASECGRHFKVMAIGERTVPLEVAKVMVQDFFEASKFPVPPQEKA